MVRLRPAAKRALLVAVLLLVVLPMPPAASQPQLEASLTSFPRWLGPEGSLRFNLRVTNSGDEVATGVRISIAIHQGLETRSHLEASFRGVLGPTIGGDTVLVDEEIDPGETATINVEKPLSEISFFRFAPEDRAYPVRITVISGLERAEPIDTHMIFFRQEAPERLRLVLVVPLHYPPVYGPGGTLSEAVHGLESSLDGGALDHIVSALEAHPEAPVALAPTGLLLETLEDLADGYPISDGDGATTVTPLDEPARNAASMLSRLANLAESEATSLLIAPHSAAFLPQMNPERAQAQIAATRQALESTVGAEPRPRGLLPLPPTGDEATLSTVQRAGIDRTFLLPAAVARPPGILTPASPVSLPVRAGFMQALVLDEGLSERLNQGELHPILARQRLLAETAVIMLERPAIPRVVAAAAPLMWDPSPELLRGLLLALRGSPWLQGVKPDEAFEEVEPSDVQAVSEEEAAALGPSPPPPSFFSALEAAARALENYADVNPDPERLALLEFRLLIAESAWWWSPSRQTEGRRMSQGIIDEVVAELAKIRAPEVQTLTLTSRTGVVPLSLTSLAEYPMEVVIRLESDKLEFPSARPCPTHPRASCLRATIQPRSQTIEINVVAEATGTGPLQVTIQTPTTRVVMDSSRLIVRSTAYNIVALAITGGAGIFLVAWWVVGFVRRHVFRLSRTA